MNAWNAVVGLWLAAAMLPTGAWGMAGDLDPSFGSAGTVTTPVGTNAAATAVVVQPDGKILAAGSPSFSLARYTTAGTLDASFGSGGTVTTTISDCGELVRAIALQPDGRIVAAGSSYHAEPCGPVTCCVPSFTLVRYTATGSLDTSFGSGGIVTSAIEAFGSDAYAVALQPDGRIVAGGESFDGSVGNFALARYTATGSLDDSFGSGGAVTTTIGSTQSAAYSVARQPDGKIVAAGYQTTFPEDPHFALARYTASGSLDMSFGSGGTVTTAVGPYFSEAHAVVLQPDGKIVAAGFSDKASDFTRGFALVRYTALGGLDASFGSGGIVTTTIGSDARVHAVARQADGKIVVAGFSPTPSMRVFALARYMTTGSLDASFGSGGIVATPINMGAEGNGVALQPDSRIVVAGYSRIGFNHFALARYLSGAVCGNGIVDSGEACDDGNTASGDCCSTTCQFNPAGTSCNDGNACTVGETCNGAGVCGGFTSCRTNSTCNVCGSKCTVQGSACKCG